MILPYSGWRLLRFVLGCALAAVVLLAGLLDGLPWWAVLTCWLGVALGLVVAVGGEEEEVSFNKVMNWTAMFLFGVLVGLIIGSLSGQHHKAKDICQAFCSEEEARVVRGLCFQVKAENEWVMCPWGEGCPEGSEQ